MTRYYFLKVDNLPGEKVLRDEINLDDFGKEEYGSGDCAAERIYKKMIFKVKKDLSDKI